jgi:hypothetical protein
MIWFFERGGQYLRCEIRREMEGSGYELVVTRPDGSEQVERFGDSATLTRRQLELETSLMTDGWTGPHGRVL